MNTFAEDTMTVLDRVDLTDSEFYASDLEGEEWGDFEDELDVFEDSPADETAGGAEYTDGLLFAD
jgi:hypothetical protein